MKYITVTFYFITSLFFASLASANIMTQNAEGVTIVFLDEKSKDVAEEVLINAMSLEGIKYKYGGSSPETGFDCSGFVNYVFKRAADVRLPRTSRGISRVGKAVEKHELQIGDLVFFNTSRTAFSHVGIYVGDGKFIHAPRTGGVVRVESMHERYWEKRFNGAKRIEQIASN